MRSLDIVCCWGVEDKGRQGAEEGYLKGRKRWDRLTGGALAGSRRTERRSVPLNPFSPRDDKDRL
jgi:hypothetical protein